MSPARANLMTLVQCRSLWIWHIWGLMVCLPPIILPLANPEFRPGALVGMMIVPLWSGIMSASVCRDFLSKPFAFAMPRHAALWRRTLITTGLIIAGVCSLVFLLAHSGLPGALVAPAFQALVLYLAIFLAGALVITASPNSSFLPGVLTLFMLIVFSDSYGANIRVAGEQAVLASPAATFVIAAIVVAGAWRSFGTRNLTRRLCGQPFLAVHSMWSGTQQAAYKNELKIKRLRTSPGKIMKSMEDFFLARMGARSARPTARALWGALYMLAGKAAPARLPNMIAAALLLAGVTVGLGFYHPERFPPGISGANLMMFLICAINAEYRFNPHAALLLTINRKNRFASLMFAALVQTGVVLAAAAVATFISVAAGLYLDKVAILGHTLTYDPIQWKAIFLFLPVLPFYFVCQLLFPKHSIIPITVVSIIAVIIAVANVERLLATPPLGLLLLQLVSWLPFIALTRQYCFFWDLRLDGK